MPEYIDGQKYPTKEDLKRIEEWDFKDFSGLLDFIEECWWYSDWGFKKKGKKVIWLELHTGGWSGNEDIISAFQSNFICWSMSWLKTVKGGHYYFKYIPFNLNLKKQIKKANRYK